MTEALRHRGPDDFGFYHDETSALGTTRLKIIDTSDNAHMPMSNEDGSIWMTYNGEVTNYKRLRDEFRLDERHEFRSSSDTEVLIHLYEEIGLDFLNHLSGMFAFCLLDRRIGKAFIVRDFFGIRPLFLMEASDRLYFSSEIKSFLELSRFRPDVNPEAIFHYFSLAYIPEEMTPFSQVRELLGGRLIECRPGHAEYHEREYYKVDYDEDLSITEAEAVPRVRELMFDAVERNLISDAPLGMTLSGGFDTSAMLGIVKALGVPEIHTFSIRVDEPSYDESRYQAIMVDYAKTIHHEVTVGPDDVMQHLVEHMAYMDEPSGDGAAIPTYLLAREAKKDVDVLLSGEGGDEVFNAYETHVAYKARHLYRSMVPGPLRNLVRSGVKRLPTDYRKLSFDFVAKRFTEGAELGVPEAHFFWRHTVSEELKRSLLRNSDYKPSAQLFADLYHSVDYPDGLNRLSLVDLKYFFIGDLMVKNDRMMMAHSVEARFPWMDRILFDYLKTVPAALRLKGLTRRYLQKQAVKGLLPPIIQRRRNMGLELPHSLWLLKGMRALIARYMTRARVERSGLLDYEAVQTMWREHESGKVDHGRAIWCVLNFMIWFDLFVFDGNYKEYWSPRA